MDRTERVELAATALAEKLIADQTAQMWTDINAEGMALLGSTVAKAINGPESRQERAMALLHVVEREVAERAMAIALEEAEAAIPRGGWNNLTGQEREDAQDLS